MKEDEDLRIAWQNFKDSLRESFDRGTVATLIVLWLVILVVVAILEK